MVSLAGSVAWFGIMFPLGVVQLNYSAGGSVGRFYGMVQLDGSVVWFSRMVQLDISVGWFSYLLKLDDFVRLFSWTVQFYSSDG